MFMAWKVVARLLASRKDTTKPAQSHKAATSELYSQDASLVGNLTAGEEQPEHMIDIHAARRQTSAFLPSPRALAERRSPTAPPKARQGHAERLAQSPLRTPNSDEVPPAAARDKQRTRSSRSATRAAPSVLSAENPLSFTARAMAEEVWNFKVLRYERLSIQFPDQQPVDAAKAPSRPNQSAARRNAPARLRNSPYGGEVPGFVGAGLC